MPTKHIGIRLPEEILDELEKLGRINNQTPNQIAKNAIIEWFESQKFVNSDVITLPRSNFANLLSLLDKSTQEKYALDIAQNVIENYEYDSHSLAEFANLENFIDSMIRFIGKKGFHWFDTIDFQTSQPPFFFTGRHKMGEIWSDVFCSIFEYIVVKSKANFRIVPEKTISSEFMVYIELEK